MIEPDRSLRHCMFAKENLVYIIILGIFNSLTYYYITDIKYILPPIFHTIFYRKIRPVSHICTGSVSSEKTGEEKNTNPVNQR